MIVVSPSQEKTDEEAVDVCKDDPKIYGELSAEGFSVVLTLSFMGVWRPEYTFLLLPVALDKVDIIGAQLADALEEIAQLKELVLAHWDSIIRINRFNGNAQTLLIYRLRNSFFWLALINVY